MQNTLSTRANSLSIVPVTTKAHLSQFLKFPYDLYRGEPHWRAPLRFDRAAQINPKKNPNLKNLEIQHFLAFKNDMVVGRLSGIVNGDHLAQHDDNTGHFGFLDAQKDPEILKALFAAVEAWLKERGLSRMVGPFNLCVNEDLGLLIDGFDTPPAVAMPYGRPDTQTTIEGLGFTKAKDLLAFWTDMHAGYPREPIVEMVVKMIDTNKHYNLRPMKKGKLKAEMRLAVDIFNDAWSNNWGFLPMSTELADHMSSEMMPILIPDLFWFVEYKGKASAFILMLPNVNEATEGMDGKLLPFGWAKFIARLKFGKMKTSRILLMGVRKEFQGKRSGTAMAGALSEKTFEIARERGYTHTEMSWILEDNKSMIRIIEQAQGVAYKTYRMYEKKI
ncbi:MAG: hypothetical protein COA43_06615 [Robiginitomaculum sp.]|nr:MAG: hypothetical protein COA43_06615 [Robiginitomaculum sp.]